MDRTIKVSHEGKEIEVPLPDNVRTPEEIAEDFVPKDFFEKEVTRRAKGMTKGLVKREELLEDEEFAQAIAEKYGFVPKSKGGDKPNEPTAEQLERMQADWKKKFLSPLETELEKERQATGGLRNRILEGQILSAAADAGVRAEMLKSVAPGQPAPIVSMMKSLFGFDGDVGEFFVVEGDSFAFSQNPKEYGHAHKGVREFLLEWVGKKENSVFLDSEPQRGPKHGRPPRAGSTKDIVLTRSQASNHQEYQDAQKRASELGVAVKVVEDTTD